MAKLEEGYLSRLNRALLRLGCKYSADSGEDISIALAAAFEAVAEKLEALEGILEAGPDRQGQTDA